MSEWIVYICEKQGRYYTGITTDLRHRLRQHRTATLKYSETYPDKHAAGSRERKLKDWSRAKKERLWWAASG